MWILAVLILFSSCTYQKPQAKDCKMTDIIIVDNKGQLRCGELVGAVGQYKVEVK